MDSRNNDSKESIPLSHQMVGERCALYISLQRLMERALVKLTDIGATEPTTPHWNDSSLNVADSVKDFMEIVINCEWVPKPQKRLSVQLFCAEWNLLLLSWLHFALWSWFTPWKNRLLFEHTFLRVISFSAPYDDHLFAFVVGNPGLLQSFSVVCTDPASEAVFGFQTTTGLGGEWYEKLWCLP